MEEMGNNVKAIREKAGLSQAELARRACVAAPSLCDIEHGHRSAWPILKRRLARALKTTEAELFPDENGAAMKTYGIQLTAEQETFLKVRFNCEDDAELRGRLQRIAVSLIDKQLVTTRVPIFYTDEGDEK